MSEPAAATLIAGWAQTEEALAPLARIVLPNCAPTTTSVASLLTAAPNYGPVAATNAPSAYATALAVRLTKSKQPTTLIGWSMGGMVALETAIKFPDLVSRLVLVSSCAKFEPPAAPGREQASLPVRAMIRGMHQDRETTLRTFFSLVYSENGHAAKPADSLQRAMSLEPDHLVHGLRYIQEFDLRSRLSEVSLPTLIIHGRRDQVIACQASLLLDASIRGSKLLIIEEGDHGLVATAPEALASTLRRFLEADPLPA